MKWTVGETKLENGRKEASVAGETGWAWLGPALCTLTPHTSTPGECTASLLSVLSAQSAVMLNNRVKCLAGKKPEVLTQRGHP